MSGSLSEVGLKRQVQCDRFIRGHGELPFLRAENGMPGLEAICPRRKLFDGEGAGRIRHGIIGIINSIAPVLHVGVQAAVHGKHVLPFGQLHEIGGPISFYGGPVEDHITSSLIGRQPLDVVGDRVPINNRDLACIVDHGDERQKPTEIRFHLGIGEGKGLAVLHAFYRHHDIFEATVRSEGHLSQTSIPSVIGQFAAKLVVWIALQLEFLWRWYGSGDGHRPVHGSPFVYGSRLIGPGIGAQPGCQRCERPCCQPESRSDASRHRYSSCHHGLFDVGYEVPGRLPNPTAAGVQTRTATAW